MSNVNPDDIRPYVTARDVSRKVFGGRLSERGVLLAAQRGEIPCVRVGRKVFFDLAAVRAALNARATASAQPRKRPAEPGETSHGHDKESQASPDSPKAPKTAGEAEFLTSSHAVRSAPTVRNAGRHP